MNTQGKILAGVSVATSGQYARFGKQALAAIRLWESYTNEHGGVWLGAEPHRLRVIDYNDHSHASRARQNAIRLLGFDGVDLLLGPYGSDLALAIAEVVRHHGRLMWNYGGATGALHTRALPVISSLSPANSYFRQLPALLRRRWPSLRRIGMIYRSDSSFGFEVAKGLTEGAQDAGMTVLHLPLPGGSIQIGSVLELLRKAVPDSVALAIGFDAEIAILHSREQWPPSVGAVAAVAAGVDDFGRELGSLAEGAIGPSQWEPERRFGEIYGPDARWFHDSFVHRFGEPPGYVAAGAFAMGLVLSLCMESAGTLDERRLRAAAAELDVHTFYGRFCIDPANGRQTGHEIVLVQWQDRKKVVLEPV